ncbi:MULTISPECIES: DNA-3-methyladenine glycosylase [Anaerococcus]|uniref:DNA-3-methyladenine glycosylase n=1 Tax=Anaerococcus TaxID=165779 RepID=UPI001AEB9B65|nr:MULTISPECIES: DNA-3-methyladenine glycosylase [Anaerococcus]MBP2070216.1 DNA-3-methyladenine glycosylase [Anaerococcus nagyae]MDU1828854.1 DNA-3-methyladenine glycosylase [Anaerococcus sp.]MDU1864029.1 DNA-3-methyladenine glycosylase [Anaerococcus sp.]MDU2566636.1 DNA-3-methyladenine glycosylase [Anaerococcus sp.]MDU3211781.1 DNA-3-methyladenine glycosylase [Anaerococcus sp.]
MIGKDFFNRDTLTVSKELLGKIIVRNTNGITYKAKIVETEAYLGINDRAAHTFGGRKTDRNKIMYEKAGTIYVYQTYGIHYLMNFVTLDENFPEAVLIRAIEPLNKIDNISINRFGKIFNKLNNYQKKNLTNGPGKLTQALEINKDLNGLDLFSDKIYLEDNSSDFNIVIDKRIGIDYSKEAVDYPYRFYIKDNSNVSVLKK